MPAEEYHDSDASATAVVIPPSVEAAGSATAAVMPAPDEEAIKEATPAPDETPADKYVDPEESTDRQPDILFDDDVSNEGVALEADGEKATSAQSVEPRCLTLAVLMDCMAALEEDPQDRVQTHE